MASMQLPKTSEVQNYGLTREEFGIAGNVGHDTEAGPRGGSAEAPKTGKDLIEDDEHAVLAAAPSQHRLEQRIRHLHAVGALYQRLQYAHRQARPRAALLLVPDKAAV